MTSFCKLSKKEKEELYNFLLEYEIDYRDTLGLDNNSTFGMEIEVVSKQKYEERKNILTWLFADPENYMSPAYDNWWLVKEMNLEEKPTEYGYEIISPILIDTEEHWELILQTLKGLQKMNYKANSLCSSHIHFGIDLLNKKSIINLLKVWALYEDILYRFSYGEFCNARPLLTKFANPISRNIKNLLYRLPDDTELLDIIHDLPAGHASGLNLSNYRNVLLELNNVIKTIEIRCPNGTLDPIIWQNNINSFGKLLEWIYFDKYDDEWLEYMFWQSETPSYENSRHYSKIDFEKALEFVDLIFEDDIDKLNFLRQYIKDVQVEKEGEPKKTLSFTKKILHY